VTNSKLYYYILCVKRKKEIFYPAVFRNIRDTSLFPYLTAETQTTQGKAKGDTLEEKLQGCGSRKRE